MQKPSTSSKTAPSSVIKETTSFPLNVSNSSSQAGQSDLNENVVPDANQADLNHQHDPSIDASINDVPYLNIVLNPDGGYNRVLLIGACRFSNNTLDFKLDLSTGKAQWVILRLYNCNGKCIVFNTYGPGASEDFLNYLRERCDFDVTNEIEVASAEHVNKVFVFDFTSCVLNGLYSSTTIRRDKISNSVILDPAGVNSFLLSNCNPDILENVCKPIPWSAACFTKTKDTPTYSKIAAKLTIFPDLLGVEEYNVMFQIRSKLPGQTEVTINNCKPVEKWLVQYVKPEPACLPLPMADSFISTPVASPSKKMRLKDESK